MRTVGDCFVVLLAQSAANAVIFGRNALDANSLSESQELLYYNSQEVLAGQSDGVAAPAVDGKLLRIILQKPRAGIWGGDFGANECNVSIGISYATDDAEINENGQLQATDFVRYALASSVSAVAAVECIGALVTQHAADSARCSLVICDATEVWLLSAAGKLWAAQCLKNGFQRVPCNGLAVTTQIDKSSVDLANALQNLSLWNGEGDLNFAACFAVSDATTALPWTAAEPSGDGSYSLLSMFDTLRAAAQANNARAASISILSANGISCHWFTVTPNASESVFKPFVFSPNPKISPLTKLSSGQSHTMLHKLHAQRKSSALEDLKCLEAACVEEISNYLAEHPTVDEELDELLKDCVEAEVKFYR